MKRTAKNPVKCKGFDESICKTCKRRDENSDRLVKKLNVSNNSLYKTCIYYIKK